MGTDNGGKKVAEGHAPRRPLWSTAGMREASATTKALVLAFAAIGIYVTFITSGVFNERLAQPEPPKEKFPDLTVVTSALSLTSALAAGLLLALTGGLFTRDPQVAPLSAWVPPALTHSIGPALGSLALKHIPYTAQVLVKSSKMVPVMVMNLVWNGTSYSLSEYVCTALIAGGVTLFSLRSSKEVKSKIQHYSPVHGYTLVLLNLLFDGWTSAFQDGIRHKYPHTNPLHIMLGMNLLTSAFSLAGYVAQPSWERALSWALGRPAAAGAGGSSLVAVFRYCQRHPEAAWELAVTVVMGVLGQLFVFLLIALFGNLTCSTVTTTRKFFSILASVVYNKSRLLPTQWLGVACVFSGISYKTYTKAGAEVAKGAKGGGAEAVAPMHADKRGAGNGESGAWEGGGRAGNGKAARKAKKAA